MMTPFLSLLGAMESWSCFQQKYHFVDVKLVCGEYYFPHFEEEIAFTF